MDGCAGIADVSAGISGAGVVTSEADVSGTAGAVTSGTAGVDTSGAGISGTVSAGAGTAAAFP